MIAEKFAGSAFPVGFDPMYRPNKLNDPRKWDPQRIFVNSMSDMHHEAFSRDQVDSVYDKMLEVTKHQYLVLTKRTPRMRAYMIGADGWLARRGLEEVPPHIWLGCTIEDDPYVFRANHLRQIPVRVRFLSVEPMIGPVPSLNLDGIGWVICGGESGNNTKDFRIMDHAWARDLRDRCVAAGVPFFFKQSSGSRTETGIELDGERWEQFPESVTPAGALFGP